MKKKAIFIMISCIVLLIISYFGYKMFVLKTYTYEYESKLSIDIGDTWNTEYEHLRDEEYFKLGEIQLKNEFKKFNKIDNTNNYILKDKKDNIKAELRYFKYVTFTEGLKTNLVISGSNKSIDKAIEEFLDDQGFKDDTEFLKYIIEYKPKKQNIFSSTKEIKNNLAVKFLKDNLLEDGIIHIVDGQYRGYVIEDEEKYEVNILDNNTKHIITFKDKEYFSKEKVVELISSIKL